MKRLLLALWASLAFYASASAIHIDSLKIVPASDTTYYLAIYGLVAPVEPCTIVDSAKTIGLADADIWLCYLANASAQVTCEATDSIYLGNLPGTPYLINLYVSITDNYLNTCQTTNKKDTFQLQYSITGVNEVSDNEVNVWPNPANGTLTVELLQEITNAEVSITNLQGQVMKATYTSAAVSTVPISDLPKGVYLLSIYSARHKWTRRFVKQ